MSCTICRSNSFTPVTVARRSAFLAEGSELIEQHIRFPVGACEVCHHVQVTDETAADQLQALYENQIYIGKRVTTQAPARRAGDANPRAHDASATPPTARSMIEFALPHVIANRDAIVDFGCSVGWILRELRGSFGIDAKRLIGVDFIPQLEPHNGIDCVVADLNALDETSELAAMPETVGFIFSTHLLEHILDPRKLLRFWHTLLAPNGHVMLEVPDHGFWIPENVPGNKYYIPLVIPEHLHYFGMNSLIRLVTSCGFEVVKSEARASLDGFLGRLMLILRKVPRDGIDDMVAYTVDRMFEAWPRIGDRAAALIEAGQCAFWGTGFGLVHMLANSKRLAAVMSRAALFDNKHGGKTLNGVPVQDEHAIEGFKGTVILTPAQAASRAAMTERGQRLGLTIVDPFTSS